MSGVKVGVIGATGMVGRQYLQILEASPLEIAELRLFASARSVGSRMTFQGESLPVEEFTVEACRGLDIALFTVSSELARQHAPRVAANGTLVIDDSSAFRMDPDVPLVVPEVNPEAAKTHKGIIAGPNCSTAQMVVALEPLHNAAGLKRVVVDTYQAASGAGKAAMDELWDHSRRFLNGERPAPENHPQSLVFNIFPHIDSFREDGYTKEEWKMLAETRKIMDLPNLRLSATCVRVPVAVGHSEALHIEFERPMSAAEAREILSTAPGIEVVDDPLNKQYPQPADAAGRDPVYVGRIRDDVSNPGGIALWCVADNVRKGAALNAVQIAELLYGVGSWIHATPAPATATTR
ncbi:MAG: aspartate-semialdehyde dehydrogenase [Chloroflexi bacterium]|nr:aspartate-semialdehyde dehydrogenase [Chloroflexota bacterium]